MDPQSPFALSSGLSEEVPDHPLLPCFEHFLLPAHLVAVLSLLQFEQALWEEGTGSLGAGRPTGLRKIRKGRKKSSRVKKG